jgi:hypothetical protein
MALTSSTSGGRSVDTVRQRTKATEFRFYTRNRPVTEIALISFMNLQKVSMNIKTWLEAEFKKRKHGMRLEHVFQRKFRKQYYITLRPFENTLEIILNFHRVPLVLVTHAQASVCK